MNEQEQAQSAPAASAAQAEPEASVVAAAEVFLADLLRRVDPGVGISVVEGDRKLYVTLSKANGFVDFEGPGIQALEHLVDLFLRRSRRQDVKVHVDIDNFRERRSQELQALAAESAEQVLESKSPVKLSPMTAWERKTVHEALEHTPDIKTHSEGNLERFVVVGLQKPSRESKKSGKGPKAAVPPVRKQAARTAEGQQPPAAPTDDDHSPA